jgi:hypothetical protein
MRSHQNPELSGKKLAIMQPYFFPYIGYYQLAASSDYFVFYNDVNYIEGGWINRNNILSREGRTMFTVPLVKPSPNKAINEIHVQSDAAWKDKFLKSLQHVYSKAPFFDAASGLVRTVIATQAETIDVLAAESIRAVFSYLSLPLRSYQSSERAYDRSADKVTKIISLARTFDCNTLLFPSGSKSLYRDEDFTPYGYTSFAVIPQVQPYKQFSPSRFEANLSMIDVLMFNEPGQIRKMLGEIKLENLND